MNKTFYDLKKRLLNNKEIKNAGWIISGRIFQMVLSLIVGLLTARYLGPSNYGLVNYGASYVALFSSICTLGINSVIIKEFADNPDEQGTALGTAIFLRAIAAVFSAAMIIVIVSVIDRNESLTILVTALCSVALLFHIFDTINYWFQFRYESKVTAMVALAAYSVVSAYKIALLILGKDVQWFAFSTSVDYIVVAILLLLVYRKHGGQCFKISIAKARSLLSQSYHYILAGMMVSIYGQTDKLMLKQMLDETSVGYYSTATAICSMWVFILAAIIDSLYPTIIRLYNDGNKKAFERKNRQLYAIVFYVSMFVSVLFYFFGGFVIKILYGDAYIPAIMPLKVVSWYTAFSYLGTARNAWIVCENKQKYLKYIYIGAAIINVMMNAIFIPLWGATGAAFASLVTQIITSLILPLFMKELKSNAKLMFEAILLKDVK
ncbi:flippase [Lacrimispora sp. 210928-DFI.3.58]|uniref:flippase n=1 Tax=Lacrimispora sp. 210928-DFI.3.58 TaxID=2883214 RepID=UPI001D067976|nr:flippase [Lacrimispora sp. 210928-DFI.3.58]MCB7320076.1 flippase [Lacrimispora sp. 210928-DFI.3.58]